MLRARRFAELDIEHLADEIEDVGKSEKRELASRMAVLLAHLLKWSPQPEKRCQQLASHDQASSADASHSRSRRRPSLKAVMRDRDWQEDVWLDALVQAHKETGLAMEDFPETCPWTTEQAAAAEFWPE